MDEEYYLDEHQTECPKCKGINIDSEREEAHDGGGDFAFEFLAWWCKDCEKEWGEEQPDTRP